MDDLVKLKCDFFDKLVKFIVNEYSAPSDGDLTNFFNFMVISKGKMYCLGNLICGCLCEQDELTLTTPEEARKNKFYIGDKTNFEKQYVDKPDGIYYKGVKVN